MPWPRTKCYMTTPPIAARMSAHFPPSRVYIAACQYEESSASTAGLLACSASAAGVLSRWAAGRPDPAARPQRSRARQPAAAPVQVFGAVAHAVDHRVVREVRRDGRLERGVVARRNRRPAAQAAADQADARLAVHLDAGDACAPAAALWPTTLSFACHCKLVISGACATAAAGEPCTPSLIADFIW